MDWFISYTMSRPSASLRALIEETERPAPRTTPLALLGVELIGSYVEFIDGDGEMLYLCRSSSGRQHKHFDIFRFNAFSSVARRTFIRERSAFSEASIVVTWYTV